MFVVSSEMRFSAREYRPKGHLGSMVGNSGIAMDCRLAGGGGRVA
jgi:hypothetical protein